MPVPQCKSLPPKVKVLKAWSLLKAVNVEFSHEMAQEAFQAAQETQMVLYQPHHAHGGEDWSWKMFKFQIDSRIINDLSSKAKDKSPIR